MSDKFGIAKAGDGMWIVGYPDGFSDTATGILCATFDDAVAEFLAAADRQCPMCGRGEVIDTYYGWTCGACGSYDVAVGCEYMGGAR